MDWYYTQGTERVGPVSEAEFRQQINSGTIRDDTFVWNPTLADWLPYAELRLDPPPMPEPTPQPSTVPVLADAAETFAPVPTRMRTGLQRTFLSLLLFMLGLGVFVEIWFRLSVDPGTIFSEYAMLQRGVYWITMLFGVLALWEQGRRPAFILRLCVAVPLVLGLINPTLYRVLIATVSAQDTEPIGAYQLIFLLGNATRIIDIACAVYGLVLLRRLGGKVSVEGR